MNQDQLDDYLLDNEEEPESDPEDLAPIPATSGKFDLKASPMPIAPTGKTSDKNVPPELLKKPFDDSQILSKQAYLQGLRERLGGLSETNSEQESNRAFNNALMKSAAQIGSFHGHVADTSALDDFKRQLDAANRQRLESSKGIYNQENKNLQNQMAANQKVDLFNQHETNETNRANIVAGQKAGDKKTATDEKKEKQYDDELNRTQKEMDQVKADVRAAENDHYKAMKAKSMAAKYKNPSNDLLNLLRADLASIAQGGQPTQHELDALDAGTLKSKFADFYTKLTNKPTSADAQAFIKQYMDYAKTIDEDAKRTIRSRYKRVLEPKKPLLRERDYNNLNNNYTNRFDLEDADQNQAAAHGNELEDLTK